MLNAEGLLNYFNFSVSRKVSQNLVEHARAAQPNPTKSMRTSL